MSKTWRVQLSTDAGKTFRKLPADLRRDVRARLYELEQEPRPRGYRKLVGFDDLYRVRVNGWRIIYTIVDAEVLVQVIEITPVTILIAVCSGPDVLPWNNGEHRIPRTLSESKGARHCCQAPI